MRTNVILFAVLVVLLAIWLAGRDSGPVPESAGAPPMFPGFNREAVDRIVITGGWLETHNVIAKLGSDWVLRSAGDYPVKSETAETFLDAVANLEKTNDLGGDPGLRERTHTDEKNGRLVRLLRGDEPLAEFRVGKSAKGGVYEEIHVAPVGGDSVYRVQTILTRDRNKPIQAQPDPFGGGVQPFDWKAHVQYLRTKWLDTGIWDLSGGEARELWLAREGVDAKMRKQADDRWELIVDGGEPVPGDADAADGIVSSLRRLSLDEVLGKWEDVRGEYGLDDPQITVVLKLRKEVEAEDAGDEGGEGEEAGEDGGKKDEKRFVMLDRVLEVGSKVVRKRYSPYDDSFDDEVYYAVRIGPEGGFDDPETDARTEYVFLINDYPVDQLRKDVEDLKAKIEDEGAGEDGTADEGADGTADEGTDGEATDQPENGAGDEAVPADGCGAGEAGDGDASGNGDEAPDDAKPADGGGAGDEPEEEDGCGAGDEQPEDEPEPEPAGTGSGG